MSTPHNSVSRVRPFKALAVAAALAAPALAGAGCESTSHSAEVPAAEAQRRPKQAAPSVPVTVVDVTQLPSARPIRALGRVSHDRDVKLGFKTGGIVAEILVAEGERVVAGQVVARLDAREIDAAVAQASAGLAKAKRDLDRASKLVDDQVIPGSNRDDARTATHVAQAALSGARFNRDSATLTAPVSGVIVKRLSEPGEVVGPGMPVLVIGADADSGATLVEVGIPAREALQVAVGDEAEVTFDGTRSAVRATVTELAPTLVPGTDQVLATLTVREHVAVPRGLVAEVKLTPPRGGTLAAIPVTALVEGRGDLAHVYVLSADGAHVDKRPIVVERLRADGQVLVQSGLDGVRQVVDAGTAWLDDGQAVTVEAPSKTQGQTPAQTPTEPIEVKESAP